MFYSSTILYNLTMMMESVFSFLPSHFSIIFLAKGKISKSVSLFLSDIGPKQSWPISVGFQIKYTSRTRYVHNGRNSLPFYMLIPEIKS